jgi:hypothetical protein
VAYIADIGVLLAHLGGGELWVKMTRPVPIFEKPNGAAEFLAADFCEVEDLYERTFVCVFSRSQ